AFDVISTSPTRKEPRTAIGQIGPLHYVILVVDGRQEGYSAGITLQDLQQLFVSYGAQTAMNLDGGGSTELWFQGQILNQPCGGEERYVSDAIYF
ncbi:MAG TPA: phosphodiester glycosidase family protein, partial [Candidatus Limiplasma sp.]|nr:phosphodiester glycosidase family protein [Candidatus Limiplasma sp.]